MYWTQHRPSSSGLVDTHGYRRLARSWKASATRGQGPAGCGRIAGAVNRTAQFFLKSSQKLSTVFSTANSETFFEFLYVMAVIIFSLKKNFLSS